MAFAVITKSNELNEPTTNVVVMPSQVIYIKVNQTEPVCVVKYYHDPNEFHRIYYK